MATDNAMSEVKRSAVDTAEAVRSEFDESLEASEARTEVVKDAVEAKVDERLDTDKFGFMSDNRAQTIQSSVMRILGPIIGIGVGVVVAAELIPDGIADFQTAVNESTVSGGAEGMLGLVTLVVALAVLIAFLTAVGGRGNGGM